MLARLLIVSLRSRPGSPFVTITRVSREDMGSASAADDASAAGVTPAGVWAAGLLLLVHPLSRAAVNTRQRSAARDFFIVIFILSFFVSIFCTVAEWKKRESVSDAPGPKQPRSTVLTIEEGTLIVAFRKHMA